MAISKKAKLSKTDIAAIGERIKTLMNVLGIRTQKEFAEKNNVSTSFISDIINGTRAPSIELIINLQVEFNINLRWFLSGSGEIFTNSDLIQDNLQIRKLIKISKDHPRVKEFLEAISNDESKLFTMVGFFLKEKVLDRETPLSNYNITKVG